MFCSRTQDPTLPSHSFDTFSVLEWAMPASLLWILLLRAGKMDTLIDYMTRNNIFIAAVQETLLRPNTTLWLPSGFSIVRVDRPADRGKGEGLAFIIHQSVNFKTHQLPLTTDPHLEQHAIVVNTGSRASPSSTCTAHQPHPAHLAIS